MSRILIIIFVLVLSVGLYHTKALSESVTPANNATESPKSPVTIKSDRSIIKPEGEIIRSWEGIGNVSFVYIDANNNFVCESEYVKFSREGTEKYTDIIELNGNISGVINGWNIQSEQLEVQLSNDGYTLFSDDELVIFQNQISFITRHIVFDSKTGMGILKDGGLIEFAMEDQRGYELREDEQRNIFTDCIRFDYSGGIFRSPDIHVLSEISADGAYNPTEVLIRGGEVQPLKWDPERPSEMLLNYAVFDIQNRNFVASDGITLRNGSCVMTANSARVDWKDREMVFEGNVEISREIVDFQAGLIRISWEENGNITLTAEGSPQMCIRVPDEAGDDLV